MGASKKKKNFYANDICPEKQRIMYVLRQAKRKFQDKVSGSACIEGRIYVWLKQSNSDKDQRLMINTVDKLRLFCNSNLGVGLESFIKNWPY